MSETLPFEIAVVPVTPFQQNCSLIKAPGGAIAVVDPGGDVDRLLAAADEMGGTIEKIWLTHGHLDHASGAMLMKERTGATIEGAHREEAFWLDQIEAVCKAYDFPGDNRNCTPDRWLEDGDQVVLGDNEVVFDVYFTPGHTPGHVVFHHPGAKLAIVGDVLFKGSIGRTDFPRGDHATLIRSITEKLWPLGEDTVFIAGHGPTSTFGAERRSNPFVSDQAVARAARSGA